MLTRAGCTAARRAGGGWVGLGRTIAVALVLCGVLVEAAPVAAQSGPGGAEGAAASAASDRRLTQPASPSAAPQSEAASKLAQNGSAGAAPSSAGTPPTRGNEDSMPAAADKRESGLRLIGFNLALSNIPVEADYTGGDTSLDLFLDYDFSSRWRLRGGLLTTSTVSDHSKLQSQGAYVAYRIDLPLGENLRAHAAAGALLMQAELTAKASGVVLAAASAGGIASAGAVYNFDGLALGAQAMLLYATANFDGLAINLGSNLLQLTAAYAF